MELKIINLNCFESPLSADRKARIWDLIPKIISLNADIICLQEINFSKTATRVSEMFRKEGYSTFQNADRLFNRGGLFLATKFPIKESAFSRFTDQGTLDSLQLTDRLLGKGFQRVVLSTNEGDIVLYNVHLVNVYEKDSRSQKKVLTSQFNQLIEEVNIEKEKLIVSGDFNFFPDDVLHAELLKVNNLVDPLSDSGSITISRYNTHKNGFYKIVSDGKTDYTLVSKDLSGEIRQKVIFDELFNINGEKMNLSDHFGLLTLGHFERLIA